MEVQWSLVLFTVIAGAGAWLFASSMVGALAKKSPLPTKIESIVSFVLLVIGGLASVTHLKHVDRIMEALNRPTSGIFVEAAFVGVLCVLIAVYFIMLTRGSGERGRKVVGTITMVVGIAFAYACGSSYLMSARSLWMTYALPLAYCVTAGAAGAGLNLLLKAIAGADEGALSFAGLIAAVVSALSLVFCLVFVVPAGSAVAESSEAIAATAVTFVAVIVACSAGLLAWKKPGSAMVAAWVVLIAGIVCAIAVRVVMWLIGTPLFDFFLMPLE